MSDEVKASRLTSAVSLFGALIMLAGIAAVIAVELLLRGLSEIGVRAVSAMGSDDSVCVAEAAWAFGAAGCALWGPRLRLGLIARHRPSLQCLGTVVSFALVFLALCLSGFVLERQFVETLQAPSLQTLSIALVISAVLFALTWKRFA